MRRAIISDQEAKEIGIKRDVLQMWNDIMQALWTMAIKTYEAKQAKEFFPVNGENEIIIGDRFTIIAYMINDMNIEVRVREGHSDNYHKLSVQYEGNDDVVCTIVFLYIIDTIMKK